MSGPIIRILVVDDHPMLRAGLAATIDPEPDMEVVALGANGREGVELFRQAKPDVTLMDIRMPVMGGVEAIQTILQEAPAAKIMVLSTFHGDEDIYRALKAGSLTYLLKDSLAENVIELIRKVAQGGRPIPPDVAQRLTDRMFQPSLTPREVQVIGLVAQGMRNKEIAAALTIGEETVQAHMKSILAKLSVHDRTAAVAVAVQRGIVHLG